MGEFPSWKLMCVSLIVSCGGSFHFGYQLVITNPSQNAFIHFVNNSFQIHYQQSLSTSAITAIWSSVVAILFVGAIIGSLMISSIANHIGRKRGLYASIGLSIIAVLLSITSYFACSFELYAISRVLLGASIASSLGLSALFLNESSPKKCRGFVSMMTGTMVQLGTVIGSIVAMPTLFGTNHHWWIIYLIEIIILIIVLFALPFMHESPGFLTICGKEDEARRAIQFYWACSSSETELVIDEIKVGMKQKATSFSLCDVWSDKNIRRGTIVGMVVSFSMGFSGIAVINAFAVQIFMETGLSVTVASIGNLVLSAVSLVVILISAMVIDRFGRRPLILIANSAIAIINVIIFALMFSFEKFQINWIGYTLIIVISLFIVFFAIGPGPLCYFISAEMVDQPARASAQSWAALTQMTCRTLLIAIYLPFSNAIGPQFAYLSLFVLPVILANVFLYFNLPETKNRNFQEVIAATRKLPSFVRWIRTRKVTQASGRVTDSCTHNSSTF